VDVVAVSGLIDHVVVDEIETALERSATNGAQAVVLQVNSRGAIVSPERFAELLTNVADASIPVAVWSARQARVHMGSLRNCSPLLT
jgi:membrane-bound serine protease (ClpP class)